MKTLTITPNDAGQRLDKFLQKAFPLLPPAMMYKAIRRKDIKLGGKRCEPGSKLSVGDVLTLYLPDDALGGRTHAFTAAPPLVDVVYEDEHVLLANKPQGLLVHEDNEHTPDTLILRIQHYLFQKGAWNPESEQSFAPALCNRIDRNTSGIVIAAKTFEALQILSDKIKSRQIAKYYLCILHGVLPDKTGLLKHYLKKDEAAGKMTVSPKPIAGAKTALTRYRVLAQQNGKSLVEAELLTGRTHQIRVQFAAIGHPLWGDAKYGNSRQNRQLGNKQALCAYKVSFDFNTPAGVLDYLTGKSFSIEVPFAGSFEDYTS